ncbi:hypothetical protein C8E03_102472 [Lachnotalea glycerini]|uniref:Uncharacterized protein n=1 Tax=Lachnotalea glycerini TaxID=1763509 RepID=A0A255I429_9FIRM|nr:hypothetical protein [Lachnotalea glycerini]PXV93697.1 hypothetical protein C8E03_102472 [Lachnotalea glycerini]RDY32643.1 hypothetical protein CG710_004240 [Lachnotalea glycerini]
MRIKVVKKVSDVIALLAPLWVYLLYKLYKMLNFNLTVYVLLCVSLLVLCVGALIVSIFIDKKNINEKSISTRNKIYVYSSIVLGTVIFAIICINIFLK